MHSHSNARLSKQQREFLRTEEKRSSRIVAKELHTSHTTIQKWKNSPESKHKSSRPETIHYALTKAEERLIVKLRDQLQWSVNELVDGLEPYIERLNHSNCYRTLLRYHRNVRLQREKRETKQFKVYEPGFVHIDIFDLPEIAGEKWCCFLAVDRATRLLYLKCYPRKTKEAAADFLFHCLRYFPFVIHTLLTDNGRQFTMRGQTSFGKKGGTSTRGVLFEILCDLAGIEHRKIQPYHPWTNGMVERMVRTVKEHTIYAHTFASLTELKSALTHFQQLHCFHRKLLHLKRKTPYTMLLEWYKNDPFLFSETPHQWKQRGETEHLDSGF